jgi:hypothetical protein
MPAMFVMTCILAIMFFMIFLNRFIHNLSDFIFSHPLLFRCFFIVIDFAIIAWTARKYAW